MTSIEEKKLIKNNYFYKC